MILLLVKCIMVSNQGIKDTIMDHISSGLHDMFKHNSFDNTSVAVMGRNIHYYASMKYVLGKK